MAIGIQFDRALSIGINYVGSSAELNGCINDVINLTNSINTKSHVVLTEVSDQKPTRANIIQAIRNFTKDVKPNEKLLFQYSGHGSYTRDRSKDEADGRDETICPLDYAKSGDIKDDLLRKLLVDSLPAGCFLLCIFDCCHSGTVLDLKYQYRVYPRQNGRRYQRQIDRHYQDSKAKVICVSGCRDDQYSADALIQGDNKTPYQGAMTWGLLQSLKQLQKVKQPITYHNLMKNLLKLLRKHRYSQIPQITSGQVLNLNELLF